MKRPAEIQHIPVLLDESLAGLNIKENGVYGDITGGYGGHSWGILSALGPKGRLMIIDMDEEAVELLREKFAHDPRVIVYKGRFSGISSWAKMGGIEAFDGIIGDFGTSALQLNKGERGFSFMREGPLDMRMSKSNGLSAHDIVNNWPQGELARIIFRYGEDRLARPIAAAIVKNRPIESTTKLASIIAGIYGRKKEKINPATRTFQALRIAVNEELDDIEKFLSSSLDILAPSGRLVAISYHSLEDRLVKNFMRENSTQCLCPPGLPVCICGHRAKLKMINKKPIMADEREIDANPRARSARLRIAERV